MDWNDLRACAPAGKCSGMYCVCKKKGVEIIDSKETRSNEVFKSTYQKINWISVHRRTGQVNMMVCFHVAQRWYCSVPSPCQTRESMRCAMKLNWLQL